MKSHLKAALMAAVIGAFGSSAMADVLILQDGTELQGRAEEVVGSPERVAFTSSTGRIELNRDRISELIEEPEEMDWTRVGDQFLKARNYSSAVQMYQKALEANPDFDQARAGLDEAQAAINAEQQERKRQMDEDLAKELESVPDLIRNESFEDAQQILNRILTRSDDEQLRTTAQTRLRDLHLAWGFSRLDRLDNKGAEEHYQRVLEMDPDNKEARERLLTIWRDDPEKKPYVLKAYQQKLEEEPNNIEYNQVVGDLLYEFQRYEEAIRPLKKVAASPRMERQGYDRKLLEAYKNAVSAQLAEQSYDNAINLYQEMLTLYPNEDRTRLTIMEYERAKSRLADDDWEGRSMLARQLVDAGLKQYAIREAQLILRYDPENEVAQQILRFYAEEELEEVQAQFNQGNYLIAREMALRFVDEHPQYEDMVKQAQETFHKADIEAKRIQKAQKEQAREIAERGLQYYQEALRFTELMKDRTVGSDARPISYKQSAIRACDRAITHMETALKIDPQLAGITGLDLDARLRDARNLYNGLTDRPSSLPRPRNR